MSTTSVGTTPNRVRVCQAGLEITNDRAEKARREKPWPERAGRILTNRRQLSQGGSRRLGHPAKLPLDLLANRLRSVGGGQSNRLGRIRGGTQRVRAHMRDACSLPRCFCGCHRCGAAHLTSGGTPNETAADGFCHAKLTTSKGSGPSDGITRPVILGSICLEQSQHPLDAIGCPHGNDPPVSFA